MAAQYKLIVRDTSGTKQAEVSDCAGLTIYRHRNAPGWLQFQVASDSVLASIVQDKWIVEAWRREQSLGISWTQELVGIVRRTQSDYYDMDNLTLTCPGIVSKLGWRHILWLTGVADRSSFASKKAETVMKTLVSYNAGANATVANGRLREGSLGITLEADGARGTAITHSCAFDNLLLSLQDISKIGGGDFGVTYSSGTLQFIWVVPTDRSSTVIFSVQRGNMSNPVYEDNRTEEATVSFVGGQGVGSAREYSVVLSTNYSASNDIETFTDARDLSTAAGRIDRGNQDLNNLRRVATFGFNAIQQPGCAYGNHYFLGDLVKGIYGSISKTVRIAGITLTPSPDGENISLELEEP